MIKLNDNFSEEPDFKEEFSRLVGEQKFGEAINYLQQVIESDNDNLQAKSLLEQINKISQIQSQDVFASTNLHLDPWFE